MLGVAVLFRYEFLSGLENISTVVKGEISLNTVAHLDLENMVVFAGWEEIVTCVVLWVFFLLHTLLRPLTHKVAD